MYCINNRLQNKYKTFRDKKFLKTNRNMVYQFKFKPNYVIYRFGKHNGSIDSMLASYGKKPNFIYWYWFYIITLLWLI
jgi:hypothetical protein